MRLLVFIPGILFMSLLGCRGPAVQEFSGPPTRLSFSEKESFYSFTDDSDIASLIVATDRSLAYFSRKQNAAKDLLHPSHTVAEKFFDITRIHRSLLIFREILLNSSGGAEITRKVQESFTFWEISNHGRARPVLFTGYYEPIIEGSIEPQNEYPFPIYRLPDDLVDFTSTETPTPDGQDRRVVRLENGQAIPYYSRREIDSGKALQGKGYELAWLKDPWERFILQIQGSGQIRLPEGKVIRVGFAGSNGRPYRSIGRYLIEQGFISDKELSLRRIKDFLQQYPDLMEETFNVNERYVFFHMIEGGEGPIGSLGIPLSPGRSIATDQTVFPPGALAYIISRQPIFDEQGRFRGKKELRRFVLNQDTGVAMRGPGRVDLFLGSGADAGRAAGEMREEGSIYFLQAR
jgi:membrane-bound lytic murein transglycosylase A